VPLTRSRSWGVITGFNLSSPERIVALGTPSTEGVSSPGLLLVKGVGRRDATSWGSAMLLVKGVADPCVSPGGSRRLFTSKMAARSADPETVEVLDRVRVGLGFSPRTRGVTPLAASRLSARNSRASFTLRFLAVPKNYQFCSALSWERVKRKKI